MIKTMIKAISMIKKHVFDFITGFILNFTRKEWKN